MGTKICRGRVIFTGAMFGSFLSACFKRGRRRNRLAGDFENAFAGYVGTRQAIAVSSGKMALYLCLKALGAVKGDEIILASYTVPEVIDVILLLEMRPVFVDIIPENATMDPAAIENKIGARTKFILMTHMHGCPCRVDDILEISGKHGLTVIEDAAQALGAEYKGKKTGGCAKIGYFSFGMLKNMNTLGGGMIVTDDEHLAAGVRKLTAHFRPLPRKELFKRLITSMLVSWVTHPVIFSFFGYPGLVLLGAGKEALLETVFQARPVTADGFSGLEVGFSPEQAALGIAQLARIDILNAERIKKARLLDRCLSGVSGISLITPPPGAKNIYLNYVIRVKQRNKLIGYLFRQGIDAGHGFVVSCAHQDRFLKFSGENCGNSREFEDENVYLPVYDELRPGDITRMARLIQEGVWN
ncbi:MAG: DegT/DnrJ/EryC1/StrS family aminotransferase [Candidatus Omnitrophica bacterium]|nr:DegT/DnrJ/EryC1/StrS family aminotransferase [Candidatus Omnitrophota bacterium]